MSRVRVELGGAVDGVVWLSAAPSTGDVVTLDGRALVVTGRGFVVAAAGDGLEQTSLLVTLAEPEGWVG